jgi:hypothetical protein
VRPSQVYPRIHLFKSDMTSARIECLFSLFSLPYSLEDLSTRNPLTMFRPSKLYLLQCTSYLVSHRSKQSAMEQEQINGYCSREIKATLVG